MTTDTSIDTITGELRTILEDLAFTTEESDVSDAIRSHVRERYVDALGKLREIERAYDLLRDPGASFR